SAARDRRAALTVERARGRRRGRGLRVGARVRGRRRRRRRSLAFALRATDGEGARKARAAVGVGGAVAVRFDACIEADVLDTRVAAAVGARHARRAGGDRRAAIVFAEETPRDPERVLVAAV